MKPTQNDLTFLESLENNDDFRSQLMMRLNESVRIAPGQNELLAMGPFTVTIYGGKDKFETIALWLYSSPDFADRKGHYLINFPIAGNGEYKNYLITPKFKIKLTPKSISYELGDERVIFTPFSKRVAKENFDMTTPVDIVDYEINGPEQQVEEFDDE